MFLHLFVGGYVDVKKFQNNMLSNELQGVLK